MRVLVTGGAGYIGSRTCKVLAESGHEPVVFDDLSQGHRWAVRWGELVGDPEHDPWRIASDQRASLQTFADYGLRMGIDFGFLDDKSAGFQLEETELLVPSRLNRLLLLIALCNLYLVSVGTHVVVTGQRRLVDSHWHRGLSYLQLGWRWLDYSLEGDAPLPMTFRLDPAPDPEPIGTTSANPQWKKPT